MTPTSHPLGSTVAGTYLYVMLIRGILMILPTTTHIRAFSTACFVRTALFRSYGVVSFVGVAGKTLTSSCPLSIQMATSTRGRESACGGERIDNPTAVPAAWELT